MSAAATDRTTRAILLFWLPLALQWAMMALEGPFLAAVIARMGDPTHNLAAYGVAFAFAILVESPVIMLMSASTALVEDRTSYFRLRNFANMLNAGSTGLLLLVLIPPVHDALMMRLIGLPADVASLVYGALWLLLPWPAAIGYRRFLHGVLIRSGRTRLVAWGTVLRILGMAAAALALYAQGALPGAWVGAIALSAGVCTEAIATRIMARTTLRELLATTAPPLAPPASVPAASALPDSALPDSALPASALFASTLPHSTLRPEQGTPAPGYREIAYFYYPLALTSFIGLTVHPLLTFFMGRAPLPVESLAVFPVVHALSFLFRSLGFSYQEAAIALLGRNCEHARSLARFGFGLGIVASGGMALVALTPVADLWFIRVSALPPELAGIAIVATRILLPLPALAVLLALQQAILVKGRATRSIGVATAVEVLVIATCFALIGWRLGVVGAYAAMLALLIGRVAGNAWLVVPVRAVLRR